MLLSTPAAATVTVTTLSGTAPAQRCWMLKEDLSPYQEPFEKTHVKGTALGYKWKGANVVTKIIAHEYNNVAFEVDGNPKLVQRETGCFFQFDVRAPNGYKFTDTPLKLKALSLHNAVPRGLVRY